MLKTHQVIPIEWLQYFDERELEMILCGVQEIDVKDWERHTILKNYQKNSKQIIWFWRLLQGPGHALLGLEIIVSLRRKAKSSIFRTLDF